MIMLCTIYYKGKIYLYYFFTKMQVYIIYKDIHIYQQIKVYAIYQYTAILYGTSTKYNLKQ